jgi:hypothetical protein
MYVLMNYICFFRTASDVLRLDTFCRWVLLKLGTFYNWDVLRLESFCSCDVLYSGHFEAGTLCINTFCIWDILRLERFVIKHFAGVHEILALSMIFCDKFISSSLQVRNATGLYFFFVFQTEL